MAADTYRFPGEHNTETGSEESRLSDRTEETRVGRGRMDLPFLFMTLIILAIGMIMVLSASFARAYYETGNATQVFVRQSLFSIFGVAAMLLVSRFRVKIFRRFSIAALVAAAILLLFVLVIGIESGGARRWIDIGISTFQPSEIAKLGIILAFARMSCIYKEKMKTFRYGVLPFLGIMAIILGLLILEPHLSACVIIVLVGAIMMFVGGTRVFWFVLVAVIAVAAGFILVKLFDYAAARIAIWKDPFIDKRGDGWQIVQSLYAVGSGGLLGLGLGQGRQKYLYLPEEHNDFIFSVVCEELGFIGASLILILFAILIIRGFWIAMHARDRYGSMIVTGLTSLLAIQVFLNVAVVTNLIPSTGISLPFFSYGGTALVLQLAEMGIILSVSRDIEAK